MIDLNKFKENFYSQHGEDGILSKLFAEIGVNSGVFCEFGAWDGMHLSNTYQLYKNGWHGIYIEGDKKRFEDLKKNITREDTELVCAFVQPEGDKSLDNILKLSKILQKAEGLDLLSIDIDSDDLAIFESIETFRPKVIVIEYNPTIPLDVEYINPRGENKGNSARSLLNCAKRKKYELVAVTFTNLILVAHEALPENIKSFGIEDVNLFPGVRFFFGYDGTLVAFKRDESGRTFLHEGELMGIPWKKAFLVQPVPKIFRHYAQGNIMDGFLFFYSLTSSLIVRPIGFIREAYRRIFSASWVSE